jgi:hypothetical protein
VFSRFESSWPKELLPFVLFSGLAEKWYSGVKMPQQIIKSEEQP